MRELIPPEKLAVFKLEDGFGWDEICGYLDKPSPDTPYPRGNAPAEFQKLVSAALGPSFRKAAILVGTSVLVPVLATGIWYYRTRR